MHWSLTVSVPSSRKPDAKSAHCSQKSSRCQRIDVTRTWASTHAGPSLRASTHSPGSMTWGRPTRINATLRVSIAPTATEPLIIYINLYRITGIGSRELWLRIKSLVVQAGGGWSWHSSTGAWYLSTKVGKLTSN